MFLALLGGEIAGGIPPPPGRAIIRPSPARVLIRMVEIGLSIFPHVMEWLADAYFLLDSCNLTIDILHYLKEDSSAGVLYKLSMQHTYCASYT